MIKKLEACLLHYQAEQHKITCQLESVLTSNTDYIAVERAIILFKDLSIIKSTIINIQNVLSDSKKQIEDTTIEQMANAIQDKINNIKPETTSNSEEI